MKVYTYSEARQHLASILDEAKEKGEVRIKRRDGSEFVLKPIESSGSPLDVPAVDTEVTKADILAAVRESRRSRKIG